MVDLSKQLALAVPMAAVLAVLYAMASGKACRGSEGGDPSSDSDGGGDTGDGSGGD